MSVIEEKSWTRPLNIAAYRNVDLIFNEFLLFHNINYVFDIHAMIVYCKNTSYVQGISSPPPWTQTPSGALLVCPDILHVIYMFPFTYCVTKSQNRECLKNGCYFRGALFSAITRKFRKLAVTSRGGFLSFSLGHLYSKDTSIQGTRDLVPKKRPHNLWICYLYWRDTSIQGKGARFLGPETRVWFQSKDTLALKTWLTTKRVDIFKCTLITIMGAFKNWTISLKLM